MYPDVFLNTYTYIFIYIYLNIHVYICMYVCMHSHMRIYLLTFCNSSIGNVSLRTLGDTGHYPTDICVYSFSYLCIYSYTQICIYMYSKGYKYILYAYT
jgi:hypothetical protein